MLFIFDVDGTLLFQTPTGMPRPDPAHPEENTFLPGVLEKCEGLIEDGHVLALASNQGGVSHGIITYEQAEAKMRYVADQVGAAFWEFCPYDPQGVVPKYAKDDTCRKPHPGMLLSLRRRTGYPWSEVVYVGNEPKDWQAALAAGVTFVWANEFF